MNPGEYAIINRDWRYIRYGDDGEELYDLRKDPNEWHNLAGDPEHAATMASMRKSAPTSFATPQEKPERPSRPRDRGRDLPVGEGRQCSGAETEEDRHRGTGKSKPGGKKNVLFIVCDDLNTHVSPSGYDPIHTPTLARFASEAQTFKRAFCQYPVCGPSRASFLTGLYPESTGVLNNTADIRKERPGTLTMPEFFRKNGYWTASVGKVFHSPRHEHGEVAWNQFLRFHQRRAACRAGSPEKFEKEHGSIENRQNRRAWREIEKKAKSKLDAQTPPGYGRSGLADAQHKDGKNARQVVSWLTAKAHGDKPFFIACGIQKPHVPFLAPDKYFDLYPTDKITYQPDRPNLWDSLPNSALSRRYEAFGFELGVENDALRREYMQAYHACVSFIDAQLEDRSSTPCRRAATRTIPSWSFSPPITAITSAIIFSGARSPCSTSAPEVPFLIRAPGLTKAGAPPRRPWWS